MNPWIAKAVVLAATVVMMAIRAPHGHRCRGVKVAKSHKTPLVREEHRLVTRGVYRGIRHPMYAALVLYSVGQGLVIPNWVAGLSNLVVFAVLLALRIGAEERMMAQQFGHEYAAYTAQTKRLIPHVW